MPKPLSLKKFIKKLKEFGFDGPYSGGKHSFMTKNSLKLRIPNPHKGDISGSLINEIIHQAGITKSDWDK